MFRNLDDYNFANKDVTIISTFLFNQSGKEIMNFLSSFGKQLVVQWPSSDSLSICCDKYNSKSHDQCATKSKNNNH